MIIPAPLYTCTNSADVGATGVKYLDTMVVGISDINGTIRINCHTSRHSKLVIRVTGYARTNGTTIGTAGIKYLDTIVAGTVAGISDINGTIRINRHVIRANKLAIPATVTCTDGTAVGAAGIKYLNTTVVAISDINVTTRIDGHTSGVVKLVILAPRNARADGAGVGPAGIKYLDTVVVVIGDINPTICIDRHANGVGKLTIRATLRTCADGVAVPKGEPLEQYSLRKAH